MMRTPHAPVISAPAPLSAAASVRRLPRAVLLAVALASALAGGLSGVPPMGASTALAASPTYEVKFRVKGIVSTTTVQARDAGQARKLVMAQYGGEARVLSVRRVD